MLTRLSRQILVPIQWVTVKPMREWIDENSAKLYIKELKPIYPTFQYFCRRYDTMYGYRYRIDISTFSKYRSTTSSYQHCQKCMKALFCVPKYSSVTTILFDTGLQSFTTDMHDACISLFLSHIDCWQYYCTCSSSVELMFTCSFSCLLFSVW